MSINSAEQIAYNILGIVDWLDHTFSDNVDMIKSLHVKTENSQGNVICLCNRTDDNSKFHVVFVFKAPYLLDFIIIFCRTALNVPLDKVEKELLTKRLPTDIFTRIIYTLF